mgnify:CR=1 FL=1
MISPASVGRRTLDQVTPESNDAPPATAPHIADTVGLVHDALEAGQHVLLEGAQGEYVMAGDVMGGDRLRANVRRLVGTGIAHDVRLPYAVLRALAGSGRVTLELAQPCTLRVGGVWRTYRGEVRLEMAQLPNLLGARGETGEDEDTLARAALQAVFAAGALQPGGGARRLRAGSAREPGHIRIVVDGRTLGSGSTFGQALADVTVRRGQEKPLAC